MSDFAAKIVVIGDEQNGKTSLISRYVDDSFNESYKATIGVQISHKQKKTNDGKSLNLMIWDIEGICTESGYPDNYLIGATSYILVVPADTADITAEFQRLKSLISSRCNDLKKIILCVSKCDLLSEKMIKKQLVKRLSEFFSDPVFLTSSKNGFGVEEVFDNIFQVIKKGEGFGLSV